MPSITPHPAGIGPCPVPAPPTLPAGPYPGAVSDGDESPGITNHCLTLVKTIVDTVPIDTPYLEGGSSAELP